VVAVGRGFLIANKDLSVHHSHLPRALEAMLTERLEAGDARAACPENAVIGVDDAFYVRFRDGHTEWHGPISFSCAVAENPHQLASVAFGESGGWVIVCDDGTIKFDNVPSELAKVLLASQKMGSKQISEVSMGANTQWFVRFNDNSWTGHLVSPELNDVVNFFQASAGDVQRVLFGEGASTWYAAGYTMEDSSWSIDRAKTM